MKKVFFVLMVAVSAGIFFVSCSNANAVENKDNKSDLAAETVDSKADTNKDNISEIAAETVDNKSGADKEEETKAVIHTGYGDIVVKLYNGTPKHRDNFIKLANSGYYNGTLFHRVIRNFMIQGGDPDSRNATPGAMLGNGGPGYTVPAEFMPEKYFHKRGALAAAREGDQVNPERASSGSQFYIVQGQVFTDSVLNLMEAYYHLKFTPEQRKAYTTVGGAPHLDGGYTVYGEVVSGMEVVDSIAAVPVDRNNRPLKDIKMEVSLLKKNDNDEE
jgi:peptidyl-prolyl cis-trans isomerase B (cyclophilin B)